MKRITSRHTSPSAMSCTYCKHCTKSTPPANDSYFQIIIYQIINPIKLLLHYYRGTISTLNLMVFFSILYMFYVSQSAKSPF